MLTYKSRVFFVINETDLNDRREMTMPTQMAEGWGLSHLSDGTILATDGSSTIYKIDRDTLRVTDQVHVTDNPQHGAHRLLAERSLHLNELEVLQDRWVFANDY